MARSSEANGDRSGSARAAKRAEKMMQAK